MKKIPMKIVLVFFISLVFCSDDEKYSLVYNRLENIPEVGTKYKYHYSKEMYFELPRKGRYQHVSEFDQIEEYMGKKEGFHIFKITRTNLDVDYRLGNLKQYCNCIAIEDSPCLVYINSDGWNDHVEPVNLPDDEYLQEVFEAAHIGNLRISNFFYPFGKQAVNLSIGDSWYANEDSLRYYFNSGSPESWTSRNTTYTLKSVKEKKGNEIAVVDIKSDVTMEMNVMVYIFGEQLFLTGNTTGTMEFIITYDINSVQLHQFRKITEYGNLIGEIEMDGEKFRTRFTIKEQGKRVKL